jgi:hypothetical protein
VAAAASAALLLLAAGPVPTFDTRTAPGFGDATAPLRAYLTARGKTRGRFCVVGYRRPGGRQAWVHWQDGNRLALWEGGDNPASRADGLRFSRRDLDLMRDVVADDQALAGSSFRVTRAWVAGVLADCARSGRRYAVRVR